MTILQALEAVFMGWLTAKINEVQHEKETHIMTTIQEIQAQLEALEAAALEERAQVSAAIDEFAVKIKNAMDTAATSGQDLSVLSDQIKAIEAEIRSIYTP